MTGSEFGWITFVFETICSGDCELYFMMVCALIVCVSGKGSSEVTRFALFVLHMFHRDTPPLQDVNMKSTTVVESWEGSKEKQSYSHSMSRNASVTFTWAFQRTNHALDVSTLSTSIATCKLQVYLQLCVQGSYEEVH